MNMWKRVLAMSLTLVLAINLLPQSLLAKAGTEMTVETVKNVSSPTVVYEDSFEVGEGGTFTVIESDTVKSTTGDNQKKWNGAAPNNDKLFYDDWQSGRVIVSGGVGGAWDGDSCLKFATDPNTPSAKNILYMEYRLHELIKVGTLSLEDGKMYVLSVWVKYDAGSTYTSRLTIQNTKAVNAGDSPNPWIKETAKSPEWTKVEVPFTYDASKSGNVKVGLQMQGDTGAGAIYFDLLQITELVDAEGISVDGTQVNVGDQVKLLPQMTPNNASTTITWTSSDPSVATVDAKGVVTGVSGGEAIITAKAVVKQYDFMKRDYVQNKASYTSQCVVTVKAPAEGIELNKVALTMAKGSTASLTATVITPGLTGDILWSSSDSAVVSVDSATGEFTAVGVGFATITAQLGKYTASCKITVQEPVTNDVAIKDGSFEFSVDNTVSGHISSKGNIKWNGANLSDNWSTYMDSGNVELTVVKNTEIAQDGRYCLMMTPAGAGRASLQYKIPASDMKPGHEYIIKVWFKGTANTDIKNRIQAVYLSSGNATTSKELTEEWTCVEHRFTYRLVEGRDPMVINIGMGNEATKGSIYIDNITITHIPREEAPATGIEFKQNEVDLNVGATKQLTVQAIPLDTTDVLTYTWLSTDESIVSVNQSGKITAVSEGKATIIVTAGKFQATCVVNVKDMSPANLGIEDGSFEQSQNNTVSGFISSAGNIGWNGADISRHWNTILDDGNVNFELIKDASIAQDGEYCIKITPASVGRGGIQYALPTSMLVDGAEYVIKVWFKGTGDNDYKNRIQAVYMKSGNLTSSTTLTDEWECLEHRFIYKYDSTRDPVLINIGMGAVGGSGSIYIDNVSIERVPKAEKVILDTYELWLENDQTHQLEVAILPDDLELNAVFKTSNANVATVDQYGKITAVGPGQATITVIATGGTTVTCEVNVVEKYIPITSITVNKNTLKVTPGWNEKLAVVFNPSNASNQKVTWSSSDSSIVKIDASGVITAMRCGTVTITATAGIFVARCVVTVENDAAFVSKTQTVNVNFGSKQTIDLSAILDGSTYTVISAPVNGSMELNGSKVVYTAYTWLMDQNLNFTDETYGDFAHATYTDTALIAVKSGNKTATIELKITISPLADLFYDESGEWITDVDVVFTEEKLAEIRAELRNENSLYRKFLDELIEQMQLKIARTPAQYVKPNYSVVSSSYDTDSRANADTAVGFMLGYILTKDLPGYEEINQKYLEKSIEWLEALLWYPFWGTLGYQNNDLAGGHHLFAVAMAYRWMQDELKDLTVDHRMGTDGSSEEAWNNTVKIYEDQPFLEALEMRMWQAGRDMYSRNYTYDCYVMNHLHVRMGGLFAAATALRSAPNLTKEEQEELIRWNAMVLYKDGNAMRFAMPDGTSQEGVPYWEYGAEWLIRAGLNSRAALNIDLFGMTQVFRYSGSYLLYNLLPMDSWEKSSSILNVGDSPLYHYNGPSNILRFIAGEYGDANAQWLAEMVEQSGIDNSSSATWISLFVADPDLKSEKPSLDETLHWFEDMDHVIARSDWSGNEDFLSIKSGIPTGKNLYEMVLNGTYGGDPDAGHAHPDANHISLFANGEFLLKDDGYADKFTANHNTLLVNGKGQLGEGSDWLLETKYMEYMAEPFIKMAVSNEVYDYIVGDATEAYAPDLGLYTYERNVLWLKQEQVLLVVDNIVAENGTELELRWFFNSDQVFEVAGGYMAIGRKNVMSIYPFTSTSNTTYEEVVFHADDIVVTDEALRQSYTGEQWQNAIAFSWNDSGMETADVHYKSAGNNIHQFEVNGKIYAIDVSTNTISISSGKLPEADSSASRDSTIAAIEINGKMLENFDPSVLEYEVAWASNAKKENVRVYTSARDASVSVKINLRQITVTCVSRDGRFTTTYVLKLREQNQAKKLDILGAVSDVDSGTYDLKSTYDGIITVGNTGNYWIAQSPRDGKISVTYDFGELVRIQRIDLALHDSLSQENYYDLLISLDGVTWTTVHEGESVEPTSDVSGNAHAFRTVLRNQALTARYMTIVLRGNVKGSVDNRDKAGIYSGINEIAVYGWKLTEEMRQLAIVNASTDVFREGYDLASSYDGIVTLGNAGSYWTVQAPESGKISVIYDFGTLSMLQKIDLAMQNSFGRTNYYDLLVSEDGKNWTVLQEMAGVAPTADISENAHAFRTILENEAILCRYVKIILRGNVDGLIDNRDTFGIFSGINEITFYGATLSTDPVFNIKPPLPDEIPTEEDEKQDIPTRPRPKPDNTIGTTDPEEIVEDGNAWILWVVVAAAAALAVAAAIAVAVVLVVVVKVKKKKAPKQDVEE